MAGSGELRRLARGLSEAAFRERYESKKVSPFLLAFVLTRRVTQHLGRARALPGQPASAEAR